MIKTTLPVLVLASLVTFATGCAATSEPEPAADDAVPSGLTITEQRTDLVRGSFERDGRRIEFDFHAVGDTRTSKVWDADGTIVESTLADGSEDTIYLAGRARVHGSLTAAKPVIEGEANIFETLNAHPTAPLYFELQSALSHANVPRALFSAPKEQGGLSLKYRDRGIVVLSPGQSTTIATTWQAWVFTELRFFAYESPYSSGCVQAQTGWSPWVCSGIVYVNANAWTTGARYYGYNVRLTNNFAPMAGQRATLGIRVQEF